jgi:hypothetical protein
MFGMEGHLSRAIGTDERWLMWDCNDPLRVDFKSKENMTKYETVSTTLGVGPELDDPWSYLRRAFPTSLVQIAEETHQQLAR